MVDFGMFTMIVITFRLNNAMLTFYYNYMDDRSEQRHYLRNIFTFSIVLAFFIIGIAYYLGPYIFDLVYKSEEVLFFPYGFTVVVYAALSEINQTYYTYLKNKKEIIRYSFVVGTQMLSVIVLQLILIAGFSMGVQGGLIGMLLANILTTGIILLLERDIITLNLRKDMIWPSLKFTLVLIPYLVIYWLMTRGGRVFLERMTDLSTVALYAVLITFCGLIIMAVEAVINGIRPFLFEQFALKENSDKRKLYLMGNMMVNLPLLAIPVIVLVGTNISLITSKENYLNIPEYTTYACFVVFLLVYARMFYQQLLYAKKSDNVTFLSLITVIVLVIGFYYFIPLYQVWGLLHATLIANVLLAILFYISGTKYQKVEYSHKNILVIPVVVFLLLFGIEFLVTSLGYSLSFFGIIQFFIVVPLIIFSNWNNILAYKDLFMTKQKHVAKS